ncbi:TPA_asm: hypothetical protein, partial [ssRNA phage Esthiorhiza.2_13]
PRKGAQGAVRTSIPRVDLSTVGMIQGSYPWDHMFCGHLGGDVGH